MRVLIVNTSEKTGGAAVAANRLMEALNNNGEKAKMLVRDKQTDCLTVVSAGDGWRQRWHFLWERWRIFMAMHFSKKHLFEVDIANAGTDITGLRSSVRPMSSISIGSIRAFSPSLSFRRYCRAASLWYGPCTICGLPRPSAIMHVAANAIRSVVIIVRCCPAVVPAMTLRPGYGTVNRPFCVPAISVSWPVADGWKGRPSGVPCSRASTFRAFPMPLIPACFILWIKRRRAGK